MSTPNRRSTDSFYVKPQVNERPGLMVDQMRLPESLVEKVRQARNESKHLAAGTTLLSKETQWCSIASRYVSYLM